VNQVTIATACPNFRAFFSTNAAPAAYPNLVSFKDAMPERKYLGVLRMENGAVSPSSFGTFIFWGEGDEDDSFNCQIVGYRKTSYGSGAVDEYVPVVLADLLCTLGGTASVVDTDNKFVKTIAVNSSIVVAGYELPANPSTCEIARIKLDLEGCQYLRLVPGTAVDATAMNGAIGGF
jgi:hypothetical protein